MAGALLLFYCAVPALASPLFDDDSVLEISLRGPLGTISRERRHEEREQFPFTLTVDGREIPVKVRVRGHSRTHHCSFPPLRLNFASGDAHATVFAGQDKLKIVTHCQNDRPRSENDAIEEYIAYRIFNLISDVGYRVRLLQIHYEDSDSNLKDLDRPYYGFLIESDEELAARVAGSIAKSDDVLYSSLNPQQAARVNVFQYLIANADWSYATRQSSDACCHNIDLIDIDQELFAIPYDFDMSGIVNARYAKPPEQAGTTQVTTRVYRGYCRSDIEDVAAAVDDIVALRDEIMAEVEAAPIVDSEEMEERKRYVSRFFEEATDDRDRLIKRFERDCIGGDR